MTELGVGEEKNREDEVDVGVVEKRVLEWTTGTGDIPEVVWKPCATETPWSPLE